LIAFERFSRKISAERYPKSFQKKKKKKKNQKPKPNLADLNFIVKRKWEIESGFTSSAHEMIHELNPTDKNGGKLDRILTLSKQTKQMN